MKGHELKTIDYDADYLWECECGALGEDLTERDRHLTVSVAAIHDAVQGLDTIWESLCENAGHFSCGEIEILIDVLHAAGMDDLGASIRWHHAQDDDDDGDYESHRALIDTPEPGSF
jgi:hypothetical protein